MTQQETEFNRASAATPRVAIIGAGMSGILMAIKLHEAGIETFTIYEKAAKLGGTWRDNTYPGLSCDVLAASYTYSFELNPNWSHRCAYGPEIQEYFEGVAEKYDLMSKMRFNKGIADARYEGGEWRITTQDGGEEIADIIVSAVGVLHHPAYPSIEGLESFEGPCFHTARWDHSVDLTGKKVAIIGTGSTSTQVIPAIAEAVDKLYVYQRTPQWVFPLPNVEYGEGRKRFLRRFPFVTKLLHTAFLALFRNFFVRAVKGGKLTSGFIGRACKRNLTDNIKDPELLAKLTPDYEPMCKRLIMSTNFYPAMNRDNVELITQGITRVVPNGIVSDDGQTREVDVLVLATGFQAQNYLRPMKFTGENGLTLDQAWRDGVRGFRTVALSGFPNLFTIMGPHSPIGSFSLISIAETQVGYIMKCIEAMRERGAKAIVPTEDATERFNQEVKEAMTKTVWSSGCQSWYIDKNGVPSLWPWSAAKFDSDLAEPDLDEFRLSA